MLWILALAATILGLSGLIYQPILGDDIVHITYGGFRILWADGGYVSLFDIWIREFIASNHVTPLNGLVYAIQISIVSLLQSAGVEVATAWGWFRIFWIVLTLFSASVFLSRLVQVLQFDKYFKGNLKIYSYSLVSASFIAFMQLHGLWSYDPLISYAVASWLTTTLGFLFLAAIIRLLDDESPGNKRSLFIAVAIGTAGILTYEMMVAFIVGAAVLAAGLLLRGYPQHWNFRDLTRVLIALGIPTLVFVATQVIRLMWPTWYEGTEPGYLAWVLPVTLFGFLNGLPLTIIPQYVNEAVDFNWHLSSNFVTLLSIGALLVIARVSLGSRLYFGRFNQWLLLTFSTLGVITLWVSATLIFSISSKYQMELGTNLGFVYLNYAVALTSLAILFGLYFLLFITLTPKAGWTIGTTFLIIVGLTHSTLNANITSTLQHKSNWTSALINSLDGKQDISTRCTHARLLDESDLPQKQKDAVIVGVSRAYLARYGDDFCAGWLPDENPPNNLALRDED